MEASSWPENLPSRIKAFQELTKGQIITNKLREMLDRPFKIESDFESVNGTVEQILGMFDNTLQILGSSNINKIPYILTNDVRYGSSSGKDDKKLEDACENIKTMKPIKTKRGCYKRRKNTCTISEVTSTLLEDGYAWRKYGQKAILNSKHQRNYYRCSHKFEQGCQATKQVQKIDDEPSKFKITYIGVHTCNSLQRAPQIIVEASNPRDNSTLISFERNTLMENDQIDTCFMPTKHPHNESVPSLCPLKQEQVSSPDNHNLWDSIVGLSQVPSESMSMMSCALDCDDIVSSGVFSSTYNTHGYEIDDLIEGDEYGDLLFALY